VKNGRIVFSVQGKLASILKAERTALNFIQRLSGIATLTRAYVDRLEGVNVRIVDTRKTTPGWREIEKYAVKIGGGSNHRMGLYDGVLIKDNHIAAGGGIRMAVDAARKRIHHLVKIEVEVTNMVELAEALSAGADVIMLDNMTPDQIRKAVKEINSRALVEVSGGVNLENIRGLAQAGVDFISVGALTHSAKSVDMSMKIRNH
jgi:nicotinate-nucleotide pyrophosphorylase (carboxylating)